MAPPALDEAGAIAGNYKFSALAKHEYSLLCGVLDDRIGGVHNWNQDGAGGAAEDVGRVLLPVWRHSEKSRGEGGIATNFFV